MTARANIPQPLVVIDQQSFMQLMQDIAEIKIALARATIQPKPEWVTVAEAALILGVTAGTIRRKIDKGEFPAKGAGKGRLIKLPR
jgi:excisionase family DNA binding protein